MRNRIACSAQTLTQLQPDMIHSVVGGQVYSLGKQYFTESRVQILESGAGSVSAEVSGTFGVYSQTIKLRSGVLSTKCSCPSNEKPFCRHCVAVLLQHYDGTAADHEPINESDHSAPSVVSSVQGQSTGGHSTSNDFNFRDVTAFVDWLESCVNKLGQAEALPAPPKLPAGAVREWSIAIDSLHRQFLKNEEAHGETQANLQAAQEQIVRLTQDLEEARHEAKNAQAASEEFKAEIHQYQASLADSDRVGQERDGLAQQLKGVREELEKKGAELGGLSEALTTLSKSLP
ncbi:SWIM zinc finger family protein [Nitrospira sp. M1]